MEEVENRGVGKWRSKKTGQWRRLAVSIWPGVYLQLYWLLNAATITTDRDTSACSVKQWRSPLSRAFGSVLVDREPCRQGQSIHRLGLCKA
ncbi:hypothetical protein ElyMa_004335600 [Elysia marginata]|uniref:Uncharacterized protein n=1 Tax=Elysia marginata TaxID=1093978 RepID=A0AAV4H0Q9_9GAST|nr:hypothetical protein ElyMa_004335600 [Elysia marginata]